MNQALVPLFYNKKSPFIRTSDENEVKCQSGKLLETGSTDSR